MIEIELNLRCSVVNQDQSNFDLHLLKTSDLLQYKSNSN